MAWAFYRELRDIPVSRPVTLDDVKRGAAYANSGYRRQSMASAKTRCLYCDRVIQPRQGHDCPHCDRGPFHRACLGEHHAGYSSACAGELDRGFGNRHED